MTEGTGRVILDPAALLDDPTATIDWYEPSRDGALVAVGVSTGGSEQSTLRVLDTDSATLLADEIPDTRAASVSWEPDGLGFLYTRYPAGDEYHRHVRSHRLGDDPAGDATVVAPDDLPDETAWPSVEVSRDGRWVLVSLSLGWSRTDVRLLDRSSGTWTTLIEGVEAVTALTFDLRRHRLVGVTTLDADRGRVVAADLDAPQSEHWITMTPEDDDKRRVVEWALPLVGGALLVRTTCWGVAELWREDGDGTDGSVEPVALPGGVADIVGVDVDDDEDLAVLAVTSFTMPARLHRWTPQEGVLPWAPLPGAPDLRGIGVVQRDYVADDGVAIPVFIVDGDTTPERDARTLLTGYGGFAITETPVYSALITAWCESGGRFAVAGIRGGAEEGEAWHRAGMREHKQRVFDDFFEAADWLVDTGYTTRGGLGAERRFERRTPDGRVHHPAPRPRRRRALRRAASRHGAVPPLPHRPALDPRVRRPRRARGLRLAPRVLAVPPDRPGHVLPAGAVHDGRGGHEGRPPPRPQVRRPSAVGHVVRRRAPDPRTHRVTRRPRHRQARRQAGRRGRRRPRLLRCGRWSRFGLLTNVAPRASRGSDQFA